MYTETIPFEQDMPMTYDTYKVSHYHLHCHVGVVEVLILLSGSAHVKVSFEEFDMKEGDFIVINAEDSHSIYATDSKCEAASLYFDMSSYKEHIPYLDYVLFACESFDLVKYKNQTHTLRRMIASLLLQLAKNQQSLQNQAPRENMIRSAEELLWIFVNEYDMKNYYSRNWNAGYHKTEKYYKIIQYIFEHYEMKNLMDHIAKNEFYSKSYITHLFKQVGASSFQDYLTYFRLYRSERLLLDSEIPIVEIAERCGFSDIKYYTSNFKKWFLRTPSEYRKIYQPEIAKISLFQRMRVEDVIDKMERLIKNNTDDTQYKAAINPLSIKTKDSWIMEQPPYAASLGNPPADSAAGQDAHQICIRIDEETNLQDLVSKFSAFQKQGFLPTLIIYYKELSLSQYNDLLLCCSSTFNNELPLTSDIEIIIAYTDLSNKPNVSRLLQNSEKYNRIKLKPMLMI